METLIKIMQPTAMVSALIVVNLILIVVFTAFMWWLMRGRATAKSTKCENANVDVQVGDWLLAIVKFIGIMVSPFILVFLLTLVKGAYEVICWRYGFKVEETFELSFIGVILIIGIFTMLIFAFKFVSVTALDSANLRKNRKDKKCL